jgi:hypothetical protein
MTKIHATRTTLLATILFMGLLMAQTAYAQDGEELRLRLNRDFGYSAIGSGQIQGTFSMIVSGPEDLSRVVFYLDDQVLDEVVEAPFRLRFVTDNYALGDHSLSAIGYTADGRELRSNIIRTEFVSASAGLGDCVSRDRSDPGRDCSRNGDRIPVWECARQGQEDRPAPGSPTPVRSPRRGDLSQL